MPTNDKISGKVKLYSYRTARVGDIFLRIPRDVVRTLEEQLAEAAGTHKDNHTTYGIRQELGADVKTVYIQFSDFHATFGHSVVEQRW